MRPKKAGPPDISSDPFHEQALPVSRTRMQLLGGAFEFECESSELRRLVDWAYAGLPRHHLQAPPPRLRVRLLLRPREQARRRAEPPLLSMQPYFAQSSGFRLRPSVSGFRGART